MNSLKFFTLIVLYTINSYKSGAQTYNIENYGAVGDGTTLNTEAVQKTIDACYVHGGGNVIIPKGIFIIGTVYLKSNIHLYLEAGAILRGSANLGDYKPYNKVHLGMLYAENSENISITGTGNIDGNGDNFFDLNKAKKIEWFGPNYTRQKENYRKVKDGEFGDGPVTPKDRPYQMFIFSNCKRVTIKDILITHAPMWTMHIADCDGVLVDGIRIWNNMFVPNNDGIDLTSDNNVTVTNCDIRTGDDGIVIVGFNHHYEIPGFKLLRHSSGNINISNCNLQSYSSGIRIGYLDQNTVRNININNCNITNSTRGIGIFLRDEGSLEDINITNINIDTRLRTGDWWGNGEPIHISAIRGKDSVILGKIKNVRFENIFCKGENGILIYGCAESIIENVTFKNISFEFTDSKLNETTGGNIDLRGCKEDRYQLFQRDIPGFLAENVKGLSIENFRLEWTGTRMPYFTNGIEVHNFNDLRIVNFKGTGSPINHKAYPIFLEDGLNVELDIKTGVMKKNVK